jgi:hypothetical protein
VRLPLPKEGVSYQQVVGLPLSVTQDFELLVADTSFGYDDRNQWRSYGEIVGRQSKEELIFYELRIWEKMNEKILLLTPLTKNLGGKN